MYGIFIRVLLGEVVSRRFIVNYSRGYITNEINM